ncbi:MAG TPA: site-specific integrase, partial [Planctomycetes bacterium]|nr:site-specific integrase [Planctomycetota bacterium]
IKLYSQKHREAWSTGQFRRRAFRYLIESVGDIKIAEFDYCCAEDFQGWLAGRMSAVSANSYVKMVRPVFSWAIRRRIIAADPFDTLRPLRTTQQDIRVFSEPEIQAILASSPNELWRARIIASLTAGLRRSEVLNLTVADIDFERQFIKIRPKRRTAYTWPWQPKNYQIRTVPLSAQLYNLLLGVILPGLPAGQPYVMLAERRYWSLQKRIGSLSERVCLCPDENFSKPFKQILRAAKISDGCFHDLRRTAITNWARCLPLRDVMSLAGHSSIETTQKYYLALGPDYLQEASRASANLIKAIGATGLEPATS